MKAVTYETKAQPGGWVTSRPLSRKQDWMKDDPHGRTSLSLNNRTIKTGKLTANSPLAGVSEARVSE